MKQIDQEKELLKALIDELDLSSDGNCLFNLENNESSTYFLDHSQEPFEPLMEYSIEKPIDLQNHLENLWNTNHCVLKKAIPVIIVAAFKNRNRIIKETVISDYIYEF